MKTEDLKNKGLSEDQIAFVMAENGKDLSKLQEENNTLKADKLQLENDKKVITKEKEDKEKAYSDLQKNTISKEDYDKKIKEIEETSKKAHEDYVLDQLLDQALESAKVLKTENSRKSVKGLLDMEKISIAKDQKSLIGAKEQLDELKKTDAHFFESTISGHSPANGINTNADGKGKSEAVSIAQERNKADSAPAESKFFN